MTKPRPTPNRKLKLARLKLLLSIPEAAELVGVSATSYARWERGVQRPQPFMLRKLCMAFKASAADLGLEYFPD